MPSLKWIGLKLDDLDRFHLANRERFVFKLNEPDRLIARSLIKKFTELEEYELIEQVKLVFFLLETKKFI